MATMHENQFKQFQVSWRHLNYTIDQKASLSRRLQERISTTSKSVGKFWKDTSKKASYDVKQAEEGLRETRILQNLNGSIRSGHLTAVIGPSGAGKTSLLNYLSGRQSKGFSGNLTITHQSGHSRKLVVSAIPQNDHLPEYLTVRENLTFACKFKNPSDGRAERDSNVQRVSNLLGLDACLDTRTVSISGGQQKRLAIAQELLSRPDILILDEPTSGLDSETCMTTLSVLKDLVGASASGMIEPIAVVLTIHQPPVDALALFDKVYVMASGGVAIYDRPPDGCGTFVEKYSGGLRVPVGYNPISFLVEIGSREFGQTPIDLLSKQVEEQHSWTLPDDPTSSALFSMDSIQQLQSSCGSWFWRTCTLYERCCLHLIRSPKLLVSRILLYLMLPFGMLLVMGREPGRANACPKVGNEYSLQRLVSSDEYTSPEIQNEILLTYENVIMLYMIIYCCMCANVAIFALLFTLDMRSSLREVQNGWYSLNSYISASLLANLPLDLILPSACVALTYWLTGQQHSPTGSITGLSGFYRVMIMSMALVISHLIGGIIGMIFGSIYVHQISTALFMSQAGLLPLVLLSGVFVRIKKMSTIARLLSLASPYRYCLSATYIARYGFNVCGCSNEVWPSMSALANVTMTGVPAALKTFANYWLALEQDEQVDEPTNSTSTRPAKDDDVFQLVASQLSLYNRFGIRLESCKDVVPFQLHELGSNENDLPQVFLALFALLVSSTLILFVTVKLTVSRRASLSQ